MKIGIISNGVNQFESAKELSLSLVLDDHSYCWQVTPKCIACFD